MILSCLKSKSGNKKVDFFIFGGAAAVAVSGHYGKHMLQTAAAVLLL